MCVCVCVCKTTVVMIIIIIIIIIVIINLNLTIRTNGIGTTQQLSENDTHKHLWDFDIQTNHLISARIPDLIIINYNKKKRICKIVDFAVPTEHRIKLKECEKEDKYRHIAREFKKTMEHEDENYTDFDSNFRYSN